MSVYWDQAKIDLAASAYVRTVVAQRKSLFESAVSFPVEMGLDPIEFAFGADGLRAEFGTPDQPGTPQIMNGLKEMARGHHEGR